MRTRLFLVAGLLVSAAGLMMSGCGGEGVTITITGVYWGEMYGDETGPIRFFIGPSGTVEGNIRVPSCASAIRIEGTVDPSGAVVFNGTACGIEFNGTGTIEQLAPGSRVWVGQGPWQASNGNSGTWEARRRGATGSIGV